MALTVSLTGDYFRQVGNINEVTATIDFDSSYPTGGESLTAADLGLRTFLTGGVAIDPKSGYTFEFDYTNAKVLVYRTATLTPAGSVAAPTFTGTANVGTAGIVQDDDTAATNGHALYVVPVPQATPARAMNGAEEHILALKSTDFATALRTRVDLTQPGIEVASVDPKQATP